MAAKDERGRAGERRAVDLLRERGYTIVDRNWRCAQGEIDVVAIDRGTVVVVEVKTRRSVAYGHPFEAIDARKGARLWRLALAWAAAHPRHARGRAVRIDAVAVIGDDPATGAVEHLRDAL